MSFGKFVQDAKVTMLGVHGDEIERLSNGHYRIVGRSDDTMNLGGIKVGCAEIERVVNLLNGIRESAAIAVPSPGGGPSELVVFVGLEESSAQTEAKLKGMMQKAIRTHLNPLFQIAHVCILSCLPRTASNKILRRELRDHFTKMQSTSPV